MSRYSHATPLYPADETEVVGQVVDFAFADTVVAADLEEPVPPSGIVVSDETGHAHCMMPIAYPPTFEPSYDVGYQGAAHPHHADPGLKTQLRDAWARMRHDVNASREEMNLLWDATANESIGSAPIVRHEDPFVRAAAVGRRVRTLFSFFEWDRADVLRAAWIGLAVFVFAATVGAIALS